MGALPERGLHGRAERSSLGAASQGHAFPSAYVSVLGRSFLLRRQSGHAGPHPLLRGPLSEVTLWECDRAGVCLWLCLCLNPNAVCICFLGLLEQITMNWAEPNTDGFPLGPGSQKGEVQVWAGPHSLGRV